MTERVPINGPIPLTNVMPSENPAPGTEFSDSQYTGAYPEGVETHFWHQARNRLIAATLRRALPANGRVLEIGCGTAVVLRQLRLTGFDCWGCDLGDPRLPREARPFVFTEQDCFQLEPAFRESMDALLLCDVLEHIEDDAGFLRRLIEAFPKSRALILTVPARAELWSNFDVHYGHFRRYDRASLASTLDGAGFTTKWNRYFFQELYLPLLATTRMSSNRKIDMRAPTRRGIHRLLAGVSGICSSVLPPGLPGTSLIAVAAPR